MMTSDSSSSDRSKNEADPGSITRLINGVEAGDSRAEAEMFERLRPHIENKAKSYMYIVDPMTDEEDILISTFTAYVLGAYSGRYQLKNRSKLFCLLARIIRSRCHDHNRHAIAAIRDRRRLISESQTIARNHGISQDQALHQLLALDAPPEARTAFEDEIVQALEKLDARDRLVAVLRLKEMTNREIAREIGQSERTVERCLEGIRKKWEDYVRP